MSFAARLRQERSRRQLSQEALAEALGVSPRSILRWEQDQALPQASVRLLVSRFFGLSPEELFDDHEEPTSLTTLWNVPHQRNPFFTGREEILQHLHEQLHREHSMALSQSWAISGLGGIGKTQIALEFAYRYRQDYRFVFWTGAATQESLLSDLFAIAECLQLPEHNSRDQKKVIAAVKQWFATHQDWLWILDNADDVAMVQDVVPSERSGHLLLTTRAQALGALAQRAEVETMGMVEATLLLLRRARLVAPDVWLDAVSEDQLAVAEALAIALDFLPLALDQAGAYIEEVGCSLSTYLDLYRLHRKTLLARRGTQTTHYPDSVATTWALSFQKIEQAHPAAAELLRLCAFLAPDHIPEELLTRAADHWPPLLQEAVVDNLTFQQMLEELRKFSLVKRLAEDQLLSVHRLVQAVQIEQMQPEEQRHRATCVVRAVNTVFPQNPQKDVALWPQCVRYLEQTQACDMLIQQHQLLLPEAADILNRTGVYLREQAFYMLAEPLFQQALLIHEQMVGTQHPDTATSLHNLALLYWYQGQYTQAEPLYQQALAIREQVLEVSHPDLTSNLNNLALLYKSQGKYGQAEPLYQRALTAREQLLEPNYLHIAESLSNLAELYRLQGKYEQTERLYQRAIVIWEQHMGPSHPGTAACLSGLALLYVETKKYEQAELLYKQALLIYEQLLEPDHPNIAQLLHNLAELYWLQKKYEQAEPLFQRVLVICEQRLGLQHIHTAHPLHGLAILYRDLGKDKQAEPLFQRALLIRKQVLEPTHPDLAATMHEFAILRQAQGYNDEACSLYKQALTARTQTLGATHPYTISTREHLAKLLLNMDQMEETAQLNATATQED